MQEVILYVFGAIFLVIAMVTVTSIVTDRRISKLRRELETLREDLEELKGKLKQQGG